MSAPGEALKQAMKCCPNPTLVVVAIDEPEAECTTCGARWGILILNAASDEDDRG